MLRYREMGKMLETGEHNKDRVEEEDKITPENNPTDELLSPDETNPDPIQNGSISEMNRHDSCNIIDEDGIVKSPLTVDSVTIKRDLINPLSYSIIERSIKLLNIIEQIVPDSENQRRIIKTLLTILNSEHGPPVFKHLYEFGAFTYREIEIKLGVPKATIHYITNKLQYLKVVEPKTVVFPFNPKTPGPRPIVWGLRGDEGKAAVDCIYRHYGLLKRDTINVIEYKHEGKIEEIIAFYRERYGKGAKNIQHPHIRAVVKDFFPIEDPLERKQVIERVYQALHREGSP